MLVNTSIHFVLMTGKKKKKQYRERRIYSTEHAPKLPHNKTKTNEMKTPHLHAKCFAESANNSAGDQSVVLKGIKNFCVWSCGEGTLE